MTHNRQAFPKLTTTVLFISYLSLANVSTSSERFSATDYKKGIFHYELNTCRNDVKSPNQKLPGYDCPEHTLYPYAGSRKYPPGVRLQYHHGDSPYAHYVCGTNPPVTGEFCNGEILQLRGKMPEKISKETAVSAFFGLAQEAPFFCPISFSSETSHEHGNYCPSQVCRQHLPFRTGYSQGTRGDFAVDGDHWVLNITLHERPKRYLLSIYTFSCPPDNCLLWKGSTVNPHCCSRSTNLNLIVRDKDRNAFKSPATSIGNGQFNVTLQKGGSFIEISVKEIVRNELVQSLVTKEGKANIVLTLPPGVYQVSGNVSHRCSAEEMQKPITLLPLNATFSPIETLDLIKRKLNWSMHTDLPVEHFEFYPLDNPQQKQATNGNSLEFSVGGHMLNKPAPLRRIFVHKVVYAGINDSDNPTELFPIDLSPFLPSNVSVSSEATTTSLVWTPPEKRAEFVSDYRLTVSKTANNIARAIRIKSNGAATHNYTYTHFRYIPGETVRIELGAIFTMKVNSEEHTFWWGPVQPVNIEIALLSSSAHSAVATTMLTISPSVGPDTPTIDIKGDNLAIILGATVGTLFVAGTLTAASMVVVYYCLKKNDIESMTLFNPDAELDE